MGKKIKAFSFKDRKINLPFEVELPDDYINWDSLTYVTYTLLTIINTSLMLLIMLLDIVTLNNMVLNQWLIFLVINLN